MYTKLGMVVVALALIWLVIKLWRSPKFDKWCNDMVDGKLKTEPTPKDTIKDIKDAEKELGKQAEQDIKEAEKLTKEADNVNEFLTDRGVIKSKENKEGS